MPTKEHLHRPGCISPSCAGCPSPPPSGPTFDEVLRMIAKAVAEEREECAKLCDAAVALHRRVPLPDGGIREDEAEHLARKIRERGRE